MSVISVTDIIKVSHIGYRYIKKSLISVTNIIKSLLYLLKISYAANYSITLHQNC